MILAPSSPSLLSRAKGHSERFKFEISMAASSNINNNSNNNNFVFCSLYFFFLKGNISFILDSRRTLALLTRQVIDLSALSLALTLPLTLSLSPS